MNFENPIYGIEPQKVFNKYRESFELQGIIVGIDNWTPQQDEEPVRLFYVYEESSKKIIQIRIAGQKDVNKHQRKLKENHRCVIKKAISEKMPQTRSFSVKGYFRLKFVPYTTFEVTNIAASFNVQEVAENFRVETVQSIQLLNVSKSNIVFIFFFSASQQINKTKSNQFFLLFLSLSLVRQK